MREKPNIQDELISTYVHEQYGVGNSSVAFLPIGYDMRAWVYRIRADNGESYFLKLRAGPVNQASLLVPRILSEYGIGQVLAPLRTLIGELCCELGSYSVVLYPFIQGENAMVAGMSDQQWREFGATLRAVHTSGLAAQLGELVPRESFALPSGALIRQVHAAVKQGAPTSPAARRFADFWHAQESFIAHTLERAEALGRQLQKKHFEHVLCHADIHSANILLAENGDLYLVDWDGPLIAPRERDLLFVVGSKIARTVTPREEALFFQTYGEVPIDWMALAYYRYERAIEDLGERGRCILLDDDLSEEAREEEARAAALDLQPGGMFESALEADSKLGAGS